MSPFDALHANVLTALRRVSEERYLTGIPQMNPELTWMVGVL
jgi:hypothetical protein